MAPLLAGGGGPIPQYLKAAITLAALAADIGMLKRTRRTGGYPSDGGTIMRPDRGHLVDGLQKARMPPASSGIRDGGVGAGPPSGHVPVLEC